MRVAGPLRRTGYARVLLCHCYRRIRLPGGRPADQPMSSIADATGLHPPELFERESVVPDLRHVPDLVAIELHDVDVVRSRALSRWWHRPALAGMGAGKDAVCADAPPRFVGRERLHLIY